MQIFYNPDLTTFQVYNYSVFQREKMNTDIILKQQNDP